MSSIDLKHIARLSRLQLNDEELKYFEGQVSQILTFIEKMKAVNVEGVPPTSHPLSLSNVFREDTPQPPLPIEELLKTAPKAKGRFFEVPKIIEDNS